METRPLRETDDRIVDLLAEGLKRDQIAERLEMPPHLVQGRMSALARMGRIERKTEWRNGHITHVPQRKRDPAGAEGLARAKERTAAAAVQQPSAAPAALMPMMPVVPPAKACCFPLWRHGERPTHRYCGQPVASGSYCAEHAAKCYGGGQNVDGLLPDVQKPRGAVAYVFGRKRGARAHLSIDPSLARTPREVEYVRLWNEGKMGKQIAALVNRSKGTVMECLHRVIKRGRRP